ncbi:DUF3817 domain-containing protein [Microbacterium saccharophilum]|uniref:DUF3817 domain-containing protein n=1 Tax=Microbacterium saccharophilum TaxID=1213358 RepID=A0A5C8HTI6_9MICO|nr:DUF3817 domain-containing protein [Microbacterium saccharophilum]
MQHEHRAGLLKLASVWVTAQRPQEPFTGRGELTVGGGIHGFVFLAYAATAVLVAKNQRWRAGPTVVAIASAIVPYATIPTEIWLHRGGRLAGEWRREPTSDVRDRAWHDRLMRQLLRRPWILGVLVMLVVAAVFVALLIIGPPGGRA